MEEFFCRACIATMPAAKFYSATAVAAIASLVLLVLAQRAFSRARLIEDMPTAKIRSASQGFTELAGVATADGNSLPAPLTTTPCLWWQFRIEKHKRTGRSSSWVTVDRGISDAPFRLRDTTGTCRIEPAGAEVSCLHKRVWYGSTPRPAAGSSGLSDRLAGTFGRRYRYTEYLIREGDPLYVLGHFQTDATGQRTLTTDRLAGQIVRRWKEDYPALLAAYDSNRDQQLDQAEWRAVTAAARERALAEQSRTPDQASLHSINKPDSGGLPFLISSHGEQQLSRRFRLKAFFCATGFLMAGALAVWLLNSRYLS